MLLSQASELWRQQRRAEGYSPRTLECYDLQMRLLIRSIGDRAIHEVALTDLRSYFGGPACAHLRPSSQANRVRMVRSFFTWLVEEEYLPKSPARKLREPKLPARVPKAMSFEELELIRDACRNAREHALVEILFATGCRAGELAGICRQDVDWERRAVVVLGKGSKEREVYFGARAAMWLRRYLAERTDDCPYLMATERRPIRQLRPHQLWYVVKSIAERVGLRDRCWPHKFRHTLGTTLLNQGAPLVAVQSILGHQKSETTLIYAHLSGANRQAAYQKHFVQ